MSDIILSTDKLNVYYGQKQAIFDVSLAFERNQITALIGASGCGKSTFLRALNLMNREVAICRTEGPIYYQGRDIKTAAFPFRRHMQFTNTLRLVPARPHHIAHHFRIRPRHIPFITYSTGVPLVQSRHQARSCCNTRRNCTVCARKLTSFGKQFVDIRCGNNVIPIDAQTIKTKLINHQQYDIFLLHRYYLIYLRL